MRSLVGQAVHDHADGEAEEIVDAAHPLGVAPRQVVVDRDDVDAAAGQRVEHRRQRRDQGLALAGFHLGDSALMEHHAADQLDVEVALAERALGGFAHHREDLGQHFSHRLVRARSRSSIALSRDLPFGDPRAQVVVALVSRSPVRVRLISSTDRPHPFQFAVVLRAEDFVAQSRLEMKPS